MFCKQKLVVLLWVKFVTEADKEGTLERLSILTHLWLKIDRSANVFTLCGMTNRYEFLCTSTIALPYNVAKCEKLKILCLLNDIQKWSNWLHICQNEAEVGHLSRSCRPLSRAKRSRSNKEEQRTDCTHLEMSFLLWPLVDCFMQLAALLSFNVVCTVFTM